MRIYDNGVYRDMTEAELAAVREMELADASEPTAEERLEALERAMLAMMMGGGADV